MKKDRGHLRHISDAISNIKKFMEGVTKEKTSKSSLERYCWHER
jgi:hypothetical protein